MEKWKTITNFENYEVSNLGRIRRDSKILKPFKDNSGYLSVDLYKNGLRNTKKIHKLVAIEFIPNNENLLCVNHKDENKTNNHASNLEWCTSTYNNTYNDRHIKAGITNRKRIKNIDLNIEYASAFEASAATLINISNIRDAANPNNKKKTAGGYRWMYIA